MLHAVKFPHASVSGALLGRRYVFPRRVPFPMRLARADPAVLAYPLCFTIYRRAITFALTAHRFCVASRYPLSRPDLQY